MSFLLAHQAWGQGLGDAARKERERRAQAAAARGKPAKVVTDEDLKQGAAAKPKPKSQPAGDGAAQSADERARLEEDAAARTNEKAQWEQRAASARRQIAEAEQGVTRLSGELERTRLDMDPNAGALDPSRMQTLEARRAKLQAELDNAQQELRQSKDALAALEEEARKSGIPPGWVRQP